MISISGLRLRHGDTWALDLAEWRVGVGERWLLTGPSGSGKSTLLHVVAGLLRPTEGRIEVDGQDLAGLDAAALDRFRGRRIGLAFQGHHLLAPLSVLDNLQLAPAMAGLAPDASRARDLLAALGLADHAGAKPHELSQGQAQRVALARALMNRPALLLADEPTANLDDEQALAAVDLLAKTARDNGATLVIASHDGRIRDRLDRRLDLPGHRP